MKSIENKSSDLDFGWEIIKKLVEINEAFKKKIDFSKQDKNHALYLTYGGIITLSVRALYAIKHGHYEELAQLHRFISESMDLALFFCESPNESRQIRQWFNGRIIERRPGNNGNLLNAERATLFKTNEKIIANIDESVETAINVLSRYLHPSYDLLTVSYDKETKVFNYYGKRLEAFSNKKIKLMVDLSVYPAITAFGMGMNTMFPENKDGDLEEGARYLKKLAEFTRKLYPESFN